MRNLITAAIALIALVPLRAQENCTDVFPASIAFSPFESSLIEIRVVNNGPIGWSYPSLVFYNANDSIAWAPAEYFALGNEQVFTLQTLEGALIPTGPFYGKLELWTGFNDSLRCTWYPEPFLCEPGACTVVHPHVLVSTGNAAGMQFTWTVTDTLQGTVASGTMTVPDGAMEAMDSVCLEPGHYALNLYNTWITGEGVYFSMRGQAWNTTSSPQVELSSGAASSFTLLEACMQQINAVEQNANGTFGVQVAGEELRLTRTDGRAIGAITVFDNAGRTVLQAFGGQDTLSLPLAQLRSGILLVRLVGANGQVITRRLPWVR